MKLWRRRQKRVEQEHEVDVRQPERQRVQPDIEKAVREDGVWWPPSYQPAEWHRRDDR